MTQLPRVRWSDDRADLAGSARNLQERCAASLSRALGRQETGPAAGQPEPASSAGDNAHPVSSAGDIAQPASSAGNNAQPVLSADEYANLTPRPRHSRLTWADKWQR